LLLTLVLALLIVSAGVAAWLDWAQYVRLLDFERIGWQRNERGELWSWARTPRRFRELRWLTIGALSAAASILLLTWYALAARRLRDAAGRELSASPAMAVTWWFIPLANIVVPPILMARFLRGAADARGGGSTVLVVVWWLTNLVAAFAASASVAMLIKAGGADDWMTLTRWLLISDVTSVPANAMSIVLIQLSVRRL
jgi:hypothetical protein